MKSVSNYNVALVFANPKLNRPCACRGSMENVFYSHHFSASYFGKGNLQIVDVLSSADMSIQPLMYVFQQNIPDWLTLHLCSVSPFSVPSYLLAHVFIQTIATIRECAATAPNATALDLFAALQKLSSLQHVVALGALVKKYPVLFEHLIQQFANQQVLIDTTWKGTKYLQFTTCRLFGIDFALFIIFIGCLSWIAASLHQQYNEPKNTVAICI